MRGEIIHLRLISLVLHPQVTGGQELGGKLGLELPRIVGGRSQGQDLGLLDARRQRVVKGLHDDRVRVIGGSVVGFVQYQNSDVIHLPQKC